MSALSNISTEIRRSLGGKGLSSCLWVGHEDAFDQTLHSLRQQEAGGFAVYALETSDRTRKPVIEAAYAIAGAAVELADFPSLGDVIDFAQTRSDPVPVIDAFTNAIRAARENSTRPALAAIAEDFAIRSFDLVALSGEQMLTERIVRSTWGSKAFLLDGVKTTYGGSAAYAALYANTNYILVANNDDELGGWALFAFRDPERSVLPIHFFTIVLNGEPFIRYHEQMLLELDCPWHWHVVEGVASLVKDTDWSLASGGHIPHTLHASGKSKDGTTEYLDELVARYPNRVTIYRKPPDVFWHGKLEMVNAPIPNIKEPCLLWQIDSDELWTAAQVEAVRRKFVENPERTAAFFWCNYYVGPGKGISTRFNYAQNPQQEWQRVWRFEPGMIWDKHEPPTLRSYDANRVAFDVGWKNPFTQREMEACGAVFDHFAYATVSQAQFKESYYGYKNAVTQWNALQEKGQGSGHLRDYFAWVPDETMFDSVDRLGWTPVAYIDAATGEWNFRDGHAIEDERRAQTANRKMKIVVDGVFFQLSNSGIARVWINLLQEWVVSGFGDRVVLLDRGGTAPRIDGVSYHTIERHNWDNLRSDAEYLQEVCDREGADLFLSTYYTTPTRTPSIFFGHDMIPESIGFDLDDVWWRQKRRAIQFAVGHIMVSHSSANDMCAFHPDIARASVLVAHNSVAPVFRPCSPEDIDAFRAKHALGRDFVMLVGERLGWKGYKNGSVVFAAIAQMRRDRRPLLVCVGGAPQLEDVGRAFLAEDDVRLLKLDDEDLRRCYGAALAYICPSTLEGFGLPIAEAMTVGAPVLVCRNSSIPEVAGEAGVYFDPNDPSSLGAAIESVRDPARRAVVVAAGGKQAATFDQVRSARQIADYCLGIVNKIRAGDIAVHAQALADAFNDAESRRAATERAATLEKTLFDIKVELSSLSRLDQSSMTHTVVAAHAAAAKAPTLGVAPSTSAEMLGRNVQHLVAIERRLASAYAQLRHTGSASGLPPDKSASLVPYACKLDDYTSIELVEVDGLFSLEGPYPQLQIPRFFRWQVVPRSRFTFNNPYPTDAWLEIEFGNVEEQQEVGVYLGNNLVKRVRPPETGWENVWRIALPVSLDAGLIHVGVEAARSSQSEADPRSLHVAIYRLRLRRRRTGDSHVIPTEGLRDLADNNF